MLSPVPDHAPSGALFDVVAIVASLGGLDALSQVLGALPAAFPLPIVGLQHLSAHSPSTLAEILAGRTRLPVRWAAHALPLRAGEVHVAPPRRRLQVTPAGRCALSVGPPVHHSRPSADVLLHSVAATRGARSIAVVLTGRLDDGAAGAAAIKRAGGRVLVQDAASARAAWGMPQAALALGCVDFVLPPSLIAAALVSLVMVPGAASLLYVPPGSAAP